MAIPTSHSADRSLQRRSVHKAVLCKGLGVSRTSWLSCLTRLANLRLLFRRQLDLQRRKVLLETLNVGGARDLNRDVVSDERSEGSDSRA
jgi:hypothetical protein